ncbi:MAG: hypothetical protein ICV81_09290 [Flavisolibacter sp.]|nr:hypothetical protein [Flavisolibacter sp.]
MRASLFNITGFLLAAFLIAGCKSQKEEFLTETLSDYYPLQIGKYLTYRLDSTVFVSLGRKEEVHVYQEKHVIDAQITDNLGRTSYRIFRYLRDSAGLKPWQSSGTYMITPLQNSVEVVEDNLRVIRLFAPIKEGTSWKGNRYLPSDPYTNEFTFSNDDNMADWNFTTQSLNETLNLNGKTYTNVITVKSVDEALNVPITDTKSYASRSLSIDKYANGIGPVYQELILWEYQPNPGANSPYKVGFGVKRTLIDHN